MNDRKVLCTSFDTHSRRQGILRLASQHNWYLMFRLNHDMPTDWQGDGVLITKSAFLGDRGQKLVRNLKRRQTPLVILEAARPEGDHPCVAGDDNAIGRLAARHFQDRNYRHAAFFSAMGSPMAYACQDERLAGFRDAWKGKTLDVWLWGRNKPDEVWEDWDKLEPWLSDRLRKAPKPLAVFAWNDDDAAKVLNVALHAKLKIPGEVAILGVDNDEDVCNHTPVRLSSIKHDLARVGHVGAAMLDRLMSGGALSHRFIRVKPQGVVTRESTGPLTLFDENLHAAMDYIRTHLEKSFGAADIATALGISRKRLDKLFAAKLRHSVGTEIAAHRIAKAKSLLQSTVIPVEEISARCGYCNVSFFAKKFRQATGTTPLAWRKRHA